MKKILLVEDDLNLGTPLAEFLTENGFFIEWVRDLKTANEKLNSEIDLILLDWNLPDGTGIDWLKRLNKKSPPVIMLTARSEITDKVLGLEFGSNDYVTKPFEPRELLARIRVQLREKNETVANTLIVETSGLLINSENHEVNFHGKPVELTKIEFKLLKLLVENPRKVFSRESLLELVWEQRSVSTRTIDVHVGQLRLKLRANLFETLHAVGYRFVPQNKETVK